jgi:hypothetical protein
MFRSSLRHPQGELLSLLKTICYRKIVIIFESQRIKIYKMRRIYFPSTAFDLFICLFTYLFGVRGGAVS